MVAKKWCWSVACIVVWAIAASCTAPPSVDSSPGETTAESTATDTGTTDAGTQDARTQEAESSSPVPTTEPTAADRATATQAASHLSALTADIRSTITSTMGEAWTTQIVDDSRPEEVCDGRAHVNFVVPADASGAVRSIAQDETGAVSVIVRAYGSAQAAAEALDYVAVTSTTDCNPLVVAEGYEDFFFAESVDEAELARVDDAEAWASHRRLINSPQDVEVAAYSAIYRVGSSLATITARVEVDDNEDPDAAVERARTLQSTVVPGVVDIVESATS